MENEQYSQIRASFERVAKLVIARAKWCGNMISSPLSMTDIRSERGLLDHLSTFPKQTSNELCGENTAARILSPIVGRLIPFLVMEFWLRVYLKCLVQKSCNIRQLSTILNFFWTSK